MDNTDISISDSLSAVFSPSDIAISEHPYGGFVEVTVAQYAPLDILAPGSREAQERQRVAVEKLELPLEIKSKVVGMHFRLIPPGEFVMGSPTSEHKRNDCEVQHAVKISKAFYMGKYQVTQWQWKKVMGSNPAKFKKVGENAPVENVSWYCCQEFLIKLAKLERLPEYSVRLPTEAEWEYACRAGTQTAFCYGNSLHSGIANFNGNCPYGDGRKAKWRLETTPVGWFESNANAWGLYDMHGNVAEWCQDWYGDYDTDAVLDPRGPASGSDRVIRDGGWIFPASDCRSAHRYFYIPGRADYALGFRLVLSAGHLTERSVVPKRDARPHGTTIIIDKELAAGPSSTDIAISDYPFDDYAPLDGLAPGSAEAQERQRETVVKLKLPLEICSKVVGIRFRLIPAGIFLMGSPKNEKGRGSDEGPQHQVTISRPFYMGKFQVTQAQWQKVMGNNPSDSKGDNLPVERLSWNDCQEYLQKLCEMESVPEGTYCLPTEAEWEYACRAGTTTRFYTGDNDSDLDRAGWYSGYKARAAGKKAPNAFGLYDMHGNVWEWCEDWNAAYASGNATDPCGPAKGSDRVIRGGRWGINADGCRSAFRTGDVPGGDCFNSGFRLSLPAVH